MGPTLERRQQEKKLVWWDSILEEVLMAHRVKSLRKAIDAQKKPFF